MKNQLFCYFSLDIKNLIENEKELKNQRSRWAHLIRHWEESGILLICEEDLKNIQKAVNDNSNELLELFLEDHLKKNSTLTSNVPSTKSENNIKFDAWEDSDLGKIGSSLLLRKDENQIKSYLEAIRPGLESCQTVRIVDGYVFSRGNYNNGISRRLFEELNKFRNITFVEIVAACYPNDSNRTGFLRHNEIESFLCEILPSGAKVQVHAKEPQRVNHHDEIDVHDRFWSFVNNESDVGLSVQIGRGVAIFAGGYHATLVSRVSSKDFKSMWEDLKKGTKPVVVEGKKPVVIE